MAIYFLPFFLIMLFSILSVSRSQNIINLAPAFYLLLVMFVGIRYASIDYFNYEEIYHYVDNISEMGFPNYIPSSGEKPTESLYALLTLFIKSVGGSFEIFIFVVASISIGMKLYAFKKMSNFFYLSVLLYIAIWMRADLGQIRNGLSSALALMAVYYLYHSRKLIFTLAATSSLLVHIAAVLSFLLIFMKKLARPWIMCAVLSVSFAMAAAGGFGMTIVLYVAEIMGLGNEFRLVRYMDSKFAESYSILGGTVLVHLIIAVFILFFYKRLVKVNKYNSVLIPMYIYGFAMMLFFIDYGIMFARIKDLFCTPASVIILPSIVLMFHRRSRPLIYLFLIAFSALMFVTTVQNAEPYQTIIFN
ncbi:EpsG family protein [Vibrio owensii]|uniref:EpsG family protein n=1 Tax=Vibrio owensii TaxID=696485 RepID=UPI002FF3E7A8